MGEVIHTPNDVIAAAKRLQGGLIAIHYNLTEDGKKSITILSYIGRDDPEKYYKTIID